MEGNSTSEVIMHLCSGYSTSNTQKASWLGGWKYFKCITLPSSIGQGRNMEIPTLSRQPCMPDCRFCDWQDTREVELAKPEDWRCNDGWTACTTQQRTRRTLLMQAASVFAISKPPACSQSKGINGQKSGATSRPSRPASYGPALCKE